MTTSFICKKGDCAKAHQPQTIRGALHDETVITNRAFFKAGSGLTAKTGNEAEKRTDVRSNFMQN